MACHGARFDPGITFPFAALYQEIFFDHAKAGDQRAGCAVRTQCHIDAETETVFGHFRNCGNQLFTEAGEVFVIRQTALRTVAGNGIAILGVAKNQIDIRRDIEFIAAEFAHAEHDHFLCAAAFFPGRRTV